MLLNLHQQSWMDSIQIESFTKCCGQNKDSMQSMLKLAKNYRKVCQPPKFSAYRKLTFRDRNPILDVTR